MRESRVYIKFFKDHIKILIFSTLVFILLGTYLYSRQAPTLEVSQLLQVQYDDSNIKDRQILTDHIVALIRDAHLNQEFKENNPTAKITVYRIGPLLISEVVESRMQCCAKGPDWGIQDETLDKVVSYSTSNFPLLKVGLPLHGMKNPNVYIYLGGGAVVGFLVGLAVSLIRLYLKKY